MILSGNDTYHHIGIRCRHAMRSVPRFVPEPDSILSSEADPRFRYTPPGSNEYEHNRQQHLNNPKHNIHRTNILPLFPPQKLYRPLPVTLFPFGLLLPRSMVCASFSLIRVLTSLFTSVAGKGWLVLKRIVPFEV
jgi:hypothetical protein